MVESILRMAQVLEKLRIFKFFHNLDSFQSSFRATPLHKLVLNTQQCLIQVFPVGIFEEMSAFLELA